MSTPEAGEPRSPAERRLAEHLEIVRTAPPPENRSLVRGVVRRARRQRALREPLHFISAIASAVLDGLGGLFGVHRHRR